MAKGTFNVMVNRKFIRKSKTKKPEKIKYLKAKTNLAMNLSKMKIHAVAYNINLMEPLLTIVEQSTLDMLEATTKFITQYFSTFLILRHPYLVISVIKVAPLNEEKNSL